MGRLSEGDSSRSDWEEWMLRISTFDDELPELDPAPLDVVLKHQQAGEIVVDKNSTIEGVHNTISSALAVAPVGGLICVFPGMYHESIAVTTKVMIRGTSWENNNRHAEVWSVGGVAIRCQAKGVVLQNLDIVERCAHRLPASFEELGQTPCCVGVSGDNSVSVISCRMHGYGSAVLCTGSARVIMKSCRLPKPHDAQTSCRFSAVICLHTSDVYVENCEFRHVRSPLITCLHRSRCTVRECDLLESNSNAIYASDSATLMVEKCNINNHAFSALFTEGNAACLLKECLIQANGNGITCQQESRAVAQACSFRECTYSAVHADDSSTCDVSECRIDEVMYPVYTTGSSRVELKGCQVRNTKQSVVCATDKSSVTLRICDIKHSHTVLTAEGEALVNSFGCRITYTRHDVVRCEEDASVTMRQTVVNCSTLGKRKPSGTLASHTSRYSAYSDLMTPNTNISNLQTGARVPSLAISSVVHDDREDEPKNHEPIRKRESALYDSHESADEDKNTARKGVRAPGLLQASAMQNPTSQNDYDFEDSDASGMPRRRGLNRRQPSQDSPLVKARTQYAGGTPPVNRKGSGQYSIPSPQSSTPHEPRLSKPLPNSKALGRGAVIARTQAKNSPQARLSSEGASGAESPVPTKARAASSYRNSPLGRNRPSLGNAPSPMQRSSHLASKSSLGSSTNFPVNGNGNGDRGSVSVDDDDAEHALGNTTPKTVSTTARSAATYRTVPERRTSQDSVNEQAISPPDSKRTPPPDSHPTESSPPPPQTPKRPAGRFTAPRPSLTQSKSAIAKPQATAKPATSMRDRLASFKGTPATRSTPAVAAAPSKPPPPPPTSARTRFASAPSKSTSTSNLSRMQPISARRGSAVSSIPSSVTSPTRRAIDSPTSTARRTSARTPLSAASSRLSSPGTGRTPARPPAVSKDPTTATPKLTGRASAANAHAQPLSKGGLTAIARKLSKPRFGN